MRLRALRHLLSDMASFSVPSGSRWMIAAAFLVLLTLGIATATTAVVPTAVYTFF